jgi:23S rRNA (adenine2503-C2)-methyltransferase
MPNHGWWKSILSFHRKEQKFMDQPANPLPFLTDLSLTELRQALVDLQLPAYRFRQVLQWLYQKRVDTFDQMKTLPKPLRLKLAETWSIEKLAIRQVLVSRDGDAVKFAFDAGDGTHCFESVILYDGKRRTACLSSQLGCDLGCVFCATGKLGLIRNLTLHEILGQMVAINDYLAGRKDGLIGNIVFMGMGEALANYTRFTNAVEILTHIDAFTITDHRITVSTAGVVPAIDRLAASNLNVGLAVSLNTFSNGKRDVLMPINRHYPIEQVVAAAGRYSHATGEPVTFEYVVVPGENDSDEAVTALGALLSATNCKINLIPLNPGANALLPIPDQTRLDDFADRLHTTGIMVTVRKSRGQDICGACGQLAGLPPEEEQHASA